MQESSKYSHQVILNSKRRTGGTASDFSYKIDLPEWKNLTHVTLKELQIPLSYYALDNVNNENVFTVTQNSITYTRAFPRGNYNAQDLAIQFGLLLGSLDVGVTYSVTYNPVDYRFTVVVSGTINVTININSIRLSELLGFNLGTNQFIDNYTSPNASTQSVEQTLRVISDICDDEELGAMIDLTIDNGTIRWSSKDIYIDKRKLHAAKSNLFNFKVVNEDGRYLDTNGIDMSMILYFF